MKIHELEVHGVKDMGHHAEVVEDDNADWFGLFGLVKGEVNDFYYPIGDFNDRSSAELAKDFLDKRQKNEATERRRQR
jgi:hypothetical protein